MSAPASTKRARDEQPRQQAPQPQPARYRVVSVVHTDRFHSARAVARLDGEARHSARAEVLAVGTALLRADHPVAAFADATGVRDLCALDDDHLARLGPDLGYGPEHARLARALSDAVAERAGSSPASRRCAS